MRRISIFGATGSVGANGVDLIRRAGGPEAYHTVALTGGRNIARLAQMASQVEREIHRMKAFLRFHEAPSEAPAPGASAAPPCG